jgi:hypothetical protein
MTGIVVALGRTTKKFVETEAKDHDVTPYVGVTERGVLGAGYRYLSGSQELGYVWANSPALLVRSWRAMKLLEEVPRVYTHQTICACWFVAGIKIHSHEEQYLRHLGEKFGSRETVDIARARILATLPLEHELQAMLEIIEKNGIRIDTDEVRHVFARISPPMDTALKSIHRQAEMRLAEGIRNRNTAAVQQAKQKRSVISPHPLRREFWERLFE